MNRERNLRDIVKPLVSEYDTIKSKNTQNSSKFKFDTRGLPVLSALKQLHESRRNRTPTVNGSTPNNDFDLNLSADTPKTPTTARPVPFQIDFNAPTTSQNLANWRFAPSEERSQRMDPVRRNIDFLSTLPNIEETPEVATAKKPRKKPLPPANTSPGISSRTRQQILEGLPIGTRTRLQQQPSAPRPQPTKKGKGLKSFTDQFDFNFIPYNRNNHIIYEYFDDPNELCDRLRLLISSRIAGNTNHMQEINSIIEELRELKCID